MYYGDVIASYKQVTYSEASIAISLSFRLWIPQVRVSHMGSSPFSSILCILHAELKVLHVAAIIISLFKHVLQKRYEVSTDAERLPSL